MSSRFVVGVRVAAFTALTLYVIAVLAVLLNADPGLATAVIADVERRLVEAGVPAWMTWGSRVQMTLNALMFVPLAFLASLAMPRQAWGNWVAYAFVLSGCAEVFQAFFLEPRAAQYVDVVANTLGALLGAVAGLALTPLLRRGGGRRST